MSLTVGVVTSRLCFTLQPVVMEFVTDCLIEQFCAEIVGEIGDNLEFFNTYALLKATAPDYVRQTQIRPILKPVLDRLLAVFGNRNLENQLTKILEKLRETSALTPGYAAGNVLNLLCQFKTDLSGYDFSNLSVC